MTDKQQGRELVRSLAKLAKPNSKLLHSKYIGGLIIRCLSGIARSQRIPIDEAGKMLNEVAKHPTLDNIAKVKNNAYDMIQIENQEIIPTDTGAIIVANHPTGLMDGIVLKGAIHEVVGGTRPVKILARSELTGVDSVLPVQVNKENGGKMDKEATLDQVKEVIQEKKGIIALFPSGAIARIDDTTGTIEEKDFKWSFWKAAVHMGTPIVATRIDAQGDRKYYEQLKTADELQKRKKLIPGIKGTIQRAQGLLGLALDTDSYQGASMKFLRVITPTEQQALVAKYPGDAGDTKICERFRQYCTGQNDKLVQEIKLTVQEMHTTSST